MENNNLHKDTLEKYRDYVIRRYKKNTLKNILTTIAIAVYTSLWWIGVALKNSLALVAGTVITIVLIFVYTLIVLLDDPVWNTGDISSDKKECCNEKSEKCDCK